VRAQAARAVSSARGADDERGGMALCDVVSVQHPRDRSYAQIAPEVDGRPSMARCMAEAPQIQRSFATQ